MKLNRAYTQSLNDSIERIKLLFSDEEKFSRFNFTSKQFTGAIKAKQVKYAHNWFSVLRRAGVIRRISTVRGPVVGRYYCVENISSNYDKIAEEFGKMLAGRGNDPYTEKTMQLNQMVLLEDILVEIVLAKQLLIKLALLKNKLNLILH